MTTVPPTIRKQFLAKLEPLSRNAHALPDPLPVGRVLYLVDRERGTGESMQVLAGEERGEYFLDYYRDLPDCSWHARIHGDGTHEDLENYEGQFGLPVKDDPAATEREHERIVAHNQRVTKLLKHKGFQP